MIAGDWNCKIGRVSSVAGGKEYVRRNTSKRVDRRGRRVMELMDANDMVILNGVRGSVAQHTCEGARGTGVDDYVAVSAGLLENTSNLEYWEEMKDIIHSDHCGVMCRVRVGEMTRRECEIKNKGEGRNKLSYGIVGRIKIVPFWAWLQEIGEERMARAVREMREAEGDLERCWLALKEGLEHMLQEGRKEAMKMNKRNRKKGGNIGKIERELKELKEERRRIMGTVKGKTGDSA